MTEPGSESRMPQYERSKMLRRTLLASCAALLLPAAAGAQEDDELRSAARGLFGTISAVTDEELRDPEVVLGQALFWDTRLSSNGEVACASCHLPEVGGADARPFSTNARGERTSRNSQTVFNSQQARAGLRWAGDRPTGAEQAIGSITGSMGFENVEDIVPLLLEHGYRDLFEQAFPGDRDAVSPANYGRAVQAYEETLRTPAAFDHWLEGDDAALTDLQVRGLDLFVSVGCAGCHNGPLFGGDSLQRFGVVADYRAHTGSRGSDTGLMKSTGREADRDVFRVQPLRNVSLTAPYFHDGAVEDLKTATQIMARVQLGRELSDTELEALLAFMNALSGDVPRNYQAPSGSD